ncbi:MAG: hypothetical protein AAGA31_12530, partial [Bacteroidota bacterium]
MQRQIAKVSLTAVLRVVLIFQFALFCGYPLSGLCQPLDFSFHKLTEEDGVPLSDEFFFFRDSKDYVWIGSDDGLFRFDGHTLIPYRQQPDQPRSLPDNRITSRCFESSEGDLWFTTYSGLVLYSREKEEFITYTTPLLQDSYQAFYRDNADRLWLRIGNHPNGSLWFFDLKTHSFIQSIPLTGKACHVIAGEDGQAEYIIQTELPNQPGLTVLELASGKLESIEFLKMPNGASRRQSSPTTGLYRDAQGGLWTGIYDGLGKYTLGRPINTAIAYLDKAIQVDSSINFVTGIVPFQDSLSLVSSYEGLFLFDHKHELFSHQFRSDYDQPGSLPLSEVKSLTRDNASTF